MYKEFALIKCIKALLGASGESESAAHQTEAFEETVLTSDECTTVKRPGITHTGRRKAFISYPGIAYGSGISYRAWTQKGEHWKDELHAPSNLR